MRRSGLKATSTSPSEMAAGPSRSRWPRWRSWTSTAKRSGASRMRSSPTLRVCEITGSSLGPRTSRARCQRPDEELHDLVVEPGPVLWEMAPARMQGGHEREQEWAGGQIVEIGPLAQGFPQLAALALCGLVAPARGVRACQGS